MCIGAPKCFRSAPNFPERPLKCILAYIGYNNKLWDWSFRTFFHAERCWATAEKLLNQPKKSILANVFHNKSNRINCSEYFSCRAILSHCWETTEFYSNKYYCISSWFGCLNVFRLVFEFRSFTSTIEVPRTLCLARCQFVAPCR